MNFVARTKCEIATINVANDLEGLAIRDINVSRMVRDVRMKKNSDYYTLFDFFRYYRYDMK